MTGTARPELLDDGTLRSYRGALKAFLRRRVRDEAEAEDLVQEAFARLYAASAGGDIRDPHAYLFRVAANLAIDQQRRARSPLSHASPYQSDDLPSSNPDQEATLRHSELQRRFEEALGELPDRRRRVFLMRRFEDRGTTAIALLLGITPRMVQKHLIAATAHLYERLRPHMDDLQ